MLLQHVNRRPAGTRICHNVGFWLSFGRDVGQRRSNVVTKLSFRRRSYDQNLPLLQRRVFDVDFFFFFNLIYLNLVCT